MESFDPFERTCNHILDWPIEAIDAPGGFLFEWWSVFWDIFIARTNEKHSEVAASYIEVSQNLTFFISLSALVFFIHITLNKSFNLEDNNEYFFHSIFSKNIGNIGNCTCH